MAASLWPHDWLSVHELWEHASRAFGRSEAIRLILWMQAHVAERVSAHLRGSTRSDRSCPKTAEAWMLRAADQRDRREHARVRFGVGGASGGARSTAAL